jgi:hypothetical protein
MPLDTAHRTYTEAQLEHPISCRIDYYKPSGITERNIDIQALCMLPSGYGIRAYCHLRDETRNFAMRRIAKIAISDRPDITTADRLLDLLHDDLLVLDDLLEKEFLNQILDDPRLVILAAGVQAAGKSQKDLTRGHLQDFLRRAVAWVDSDFALEPLMSFKPTRREFKQALRRVYARSHDEMFFELSQLVLLNPAPSKASLDLLRLALAEFNQITRPSPWHR